MRNAGLAKRMLLPCGSGFFLAWINCAFLSPNAELERTHTLMVNWVVSLAGVFLGLVALVLLERSCGQFATKKITLRITAIVFTLGTFAMYFGRIYTDSLWGIVSIVGAFCAGIAAAVLFVDWTVVYGKMDPEDSELIIPLATVFDQLIVLLVGGLSGLLETIILVALPLLSLFCLVGCMSLGLWVSDSSAGVALDTEEERFVSKNQVLKIHRTKIITGWRSGLFTASIWFVLTTITVLVKEVPNESFLAAYVWPFFVTVFLLLAFLLLFVLRSRRLTLFSASRVAFFVTIAGLVVMLIVPNRQLELAFLFVRSIALFYWAILWIECARAIHDESASATNVGGSARAWVQGGALIGALFVTLLNPQDLHLVVGLDIVVLTSAFCLALPSFARAIVSYGTDLMHALPDRTENYASDNAILRSDDRCESIQCNEMSQVINLDKSVSFVDQSAKESERSYQSFFDKYALSPREREIAAYLLRGRNLPYIRDVLFISRNTINTHIRHIYAKMNIHSKQELIDLFEQAEADSLE